MQQIQQEILTAFKDRQTIDLATCEGLQPRLRPMTLLFKQNRFFMATGSTDTKVNQIRSNPACEILYLMRNDTNSGYIRLAGDLVTITDPQTRKDIADFSGYIYNYWESSEDPRYVLLELLPREAQWMKPGEMYAQTIQWESHE